MLVIPTTLMPCWLPVTALAVRRSTSRWSRVRTVADFERLARRRTPRPVFDYVEGAAELELSRDRAVAAFRRAVFHPHVLRDVSAVDTATTILGRPAALPAVLGQAEANLPPGRIKIEGAVDGREKRLRQIRPHRLERRGTRLDRTGCLQEGAAPERMTARQGLPEHQPHRPHVGRLGRQAAGQAFRGDVGERARHVALRRQRPRSVVRRGPNVGQQHHE